MADFEFENTTRGSITKNTASTPFNIPTTSGFDGDLIVPYAIKKSNTVNGTIPPQNTFLPDIQGIPNVDEVLSGNNGAWKGATFFNIEWRSDGTLVSTEQTYTVQASDRGKTITRFVQAVTANGLATSGFVQASNSLLIPGTVSDGVLTDADFVFSEATADADTRKTYIEVYEDPIPGESWWVYRGSAQDGILQAGSLAAMTWDGEKWIWKSSGRAAVGTPADRTIQYVRVAAKRADGTFYWSSPANRFFYASSIPDAPLVAFEQGTGSGEFVINIISGSDGSGRAVTGYMYRISGGAWAAVPGGTAIGRRTIGGFSALQVLSNVQVMAQNVNGDGVATATGINVTCGNTATKPGVYPSAQVTLADKPSVSGNTLTLGVTGPLPNDGGSTITDIKYRLNGGSYISLGTTLPISLDITVPALALATVDVVTVNGVGTSDPTTVTKTPTQISGVTTTASFGSLTEANDGGWCPETTAGVEVTVTSIVSQAGMTQVWGVLNGRLVCTNGTPVADNGKSLTVSTPIGNVTATISTVANAWSACDDVQLRKYLKKTDASARSILLRGTKYDLGVGSGSAGLGSIFNVYNFATSVAMKRTLKMHPGQVAKPYSVDTCSELRDVQWLRIEDFRFTVVNGTDASIDLLHAARGSKSRGIKGIELIRCEFSAAEIPAAILNDTANWPNGPSTVGLKLAKGPMLYLSSYQCWDTVVEDCLFRNVVSAGNYGVRGAFSLQRNKVEIVYGDCYRLFGCDQSAIPDESPKIIRDNTAYGVFGKSNEIRNADGTSAQSPHTDFFQLEVGSLANVLFARNYCVNGPFRGNSIQHHQINGTVIRCIIWQDGMTNKDSNWGMNGTWHNTVVSQCSFLSSDYPNASVLRSLNSQGEILIQDSYFVAPTTSSLKFTALTGAADPGTITEMDNERTIGLVRSVNFNWPGSEPTTLAGVIAAATPKVGSTVETKKQGALNTSGGWRTNEFPPMHGNPPTLTLSGADVIVTPSVSWLYQTLPTRWLLAYRNADGAAWTIVPSACRPVGKTRPSLASYISTSTYTLVAPTIAGLQVKTKWISSEGLEGTWSKPQTVIV